MTARSENSSDRVAGKRVERKGAASKTRKPTVGYAFTGSMVDLTKVIEGGVRSGRIRTFFVPGTSGDEHELMRSGRFSPVRLDDLLGRPSRDRSRSSERSSAGRADTSEVGAEAFEPDARARSILRGREYAAQDLRASGGAFDIGQVRALLNHVSRQAVDKRVADGSLLAVPGPRGLRRFPTVQFDGNGNVVQGLREVRQALGYSSPWAVLNFLVNGNDHLNGRRPIDALRQGEVASVVAAAASVGVQGA